MTTSRETKPGSLIVTRNLPPLVGGMERLNWHMVEALAAAGPVHVVGPAGCGASLPQGVTCDEVRIRPLWRFIVSACWHALRAARRRRPALVMAGSGLTAPLAWLAARSCSARSAVYVHGLDLVVPHPVYRLLWLPFIRRCDRVIANSRNTARLARAAGVPVERLVVIHPGVEIPDLNPAAGKAFRERHGIGHKPMLLSVGRLTARKGIREFVEKALPTVLREIDDALFVVIGDDAPDALQAGGGEMAGVMRAAEQLGLAGRMRLLGTCDDHELSQAYMAADVLVFPVRQLPGDVEGFGMVAVEAAAHGLPTVAFNAGGVPDAVSPGESGDLIAVGDYGAFADATIRRLDSRNGDAMRDSARRFARTFEWAEFGRRLRQLLENAALPHASSCRSLHS